MRIAQTQRPKEPNYYELALLLAHAQVRSIEDDWAEFMDHLSRICDGFARARAACHKAFE